MHAVKDYSVSGVFCCILKAIADLLNTSDEFPVMSNPVMTHMFACIAGYVCQIKLIETQSPLSFCPYWATPLGPTRCEAHTH